jgi:hypothetical protein
MGERLGEFWSNQAGSSCLGGQRSAGDVGEQLGQCRHARVQLSRELRL